MKPISARGSGEYEARQAEEKLVLVPPGTATATDQDDLPSNDAAKEPAEQELAGKLQEESAQEWAANLVTQTETETETATAEAVYSVKLAPQFKKAPRSLDSLALIEAALGLLFDTGPHTSSHAVVSGVLVGGPAHKAGVLLGSILLAVNGQSPVAAAGGAALIKMIEETAALESSQLELSFQGPGPLSATTHNVAATDVAPVSGRSKEKRSGRRGKRAVAAQKQQKRKQRRGQRGDATSRFHKALQGLRDIPLAEAIFEESMIAAAAANDGAAKGAWGHHVGGEPLGDGVPNSPDIIDFGRPMELHTVQGPRSESSNTRQEDSVRRSKCFWYFSVSITGHVQNLIGALV